jgi:hypothetical protein
MQKNEVYAKTMRYAKMVCKKNPTQPLRYAKDGMQKYEVCKKNKQKNQPQPKQPLRYAKKGMQKKGQVCQYLFFQYEITDEVKS